MLYTLEDYVFKKIWCLVLVDVVGVGGDDSDDDYGNDDGGGGNQSL